MPSWKTPKKDRQLPREVWEEAERIIAEGQARGMKTGLVDLDNWEEWDGYVGNYRYHRPNGIPFYEGMTGSINDHRIPFLSRYQDHTTRTRMSKAGEMFSEYLRNGEKPYITIPYSEKKLCENSTPESVINEQTRRIHCVEWVFIDNSWKHNVNDMINTSMNTSQTREKKRVAMLSFYENNPEKRERQREKALESWRNYSEEKIVRRANAISIARKKSYEDHPEQRKNVGDKNRKIWENKTEEERLQHSKKVSAALKRSPKAAQRDFANNGYALPEQREALRALRAKLDIEKRQKRLYPKSKKPIKLAHLSLVSPKASLFMRMRYGIGDYEGTGGMSYAELVKATGSPYQNIVAFSNQTLKNLEKRLGYA